MKENSIVDMTAGQPLLAITRFAVPILLGSLFQQFYNMADTVLVSRFLGISAFAGVSSMSGMSNLLIGFATGMTSGLSIVLAQSVGAGNQENIRRQYLTNLLISLFSGALLTMAALAGLPWFLKLLHTPADLLPYAQSYLQVLFAGILVTVLYNFLANTLRALGDSRSPLHYLLVASFTNVVLDFLFLRFTSLGVSGAALATILSQLLSVILCLAKIVRSMPVLSLKGYRSGIFFRDILHNLKIGLPVGFQASIISLGVVFIQYAANNMGPVVVSAYSLSQKIDGIAVEPLRALGMAMSTYTAQNAGARKNQRILTGIRQAVFASLSVSAVLAVLMMFGGRLFAGIFIGFEHTQILTLSQKFLTIHGLLYGILALLFIYRFSLQGLGYTLIPMLAGLMELAVRACSAFLLVPRLGFTGACMETPLSWLGALLPCLIAYRMAVKKIQAQTEPDGFHKISSTRKCGRKQGESLCSLLSGNKKEQHAAA